MSKVAYAYTDNKPGDGLPKEAPEGLVNDPSYKTSQNEPVPVIDDEEPVEDPVRPGAADSNKQLQKDEREAMDESNIVEERTRHAKPARGTYAEPSDEQLGLTEES